jgi:tRNA (guanosine-2'-O-)-methyltransferase
MTNHKHNLLAYLEGFITENRKQRFLDVLANRTNHFTIALEDVYQLHSTSAVMRSCEVFGIQNMHVVEQRYGTAGARILSCTYQIKSKMPRNCGICCFNYTV